MTEPDIIQTILKDSNYDIALFDESEIQALRAEIHTQTLRGKETAFMRCPIRKKPVQLKPEELIRQLYAARLLNRYHYPSNRVRFEHVVNFGREKKRADIVIFEKDRPDTPYVIIEVKKPKLQDGKDQLRSYCNATGASIAVWTNGQQISHYHRKNPNYFEDITDIPNANQALKNILSERFTLKQLILKDKLITEHRSLKDVILELEDDVLANAGVDVFEEVFKLIFTKLYDEYKSQDDQKLITDRQRQQGKPIAEISDDGLRDMEFRNTGQTASELKEEIQRLFNDAKEKWDGVFPEHSIFELSDSHLAVCVSSLQDVKLFNSNLQVVDEAFEYLASKSAKSDKGQYFTPRHVIDMCVKMINPKPGEKMIDTASGSCGFPVHTFFKLKGSLFTNSPNSDEDKEHALNVFGIDFDEKTVRVARTLNLIAGDGETNVLHLNTLDYERWSDTTEKNNRWVLTYGTGFERFKKLRVEENENKEFNFDILMANPPFAGDIKESRIIHQYELGLKPDGKARTKVGRDILFIERNLDFLKPGGRMAIVLPQGRFNNTSDKHIREFIEGQARILAVIGLDTNTFKPHTSTKTSILFLQKWNSDLSKGPLCRKEDDYSIFFAVSEKSGKDTSGEYVYLKDSDGQYILDEEGHWIVDHDLYKHNDEDPDGIADAFIKWAKIEELSFWV